MSIKRKFECKFILLPDEGTDHTRKLVLDYTFTKGHRGSHDEPPEADSIEITAIQLTDPKDGKVLEVPNWMREMIEGDEALGGSIIADARERDLADKDAYDEMRADDLRNGLG